MDAAINVATDGSLILLDRNCEYNVSTTLSHRSVSIGAYGSGAKPIISRFIKVRNVNKNLFVKDSGTENIWTINFDRLVTLSGLSADKLLNIGFIYNPYTQTITYGSRVAFKTFEEASVGFDNQLPTYSQVQAYSWLENNGDFYQSSDGHTIKVFSSTNPNESYYPKNYNKPTYGTDPRSIQELWIAVESVFMAYPHDCEIQDVELIGFGRYCFEGVKSNVTIKNVDIDLIGGSLLDRTTVDTKRFNRIGTAIYISTSIQTPANNVLVQHCHISRVFDAALSLNGQLTEYREYGSENIVFEHNCIENCAALNATMYYIDSSGWVHGTSMVKNSRFSNNKVLFADINDFNSKFLKSFALQNGIPGFDISNNIFYCSALMYKTTDEFGFDMGYGNICFLKAGSYFYCQFGDSHTELAYPLSPNYTNVSEVISQYRSIAHDLHTVFIGIDSVISFPPLYKQV